jgi:hypothetical protein
MHEAKKRGVYPCNKMDQNAKLIGSITRIRLNKLVKLGALCAICSVAFVSTSPFLP